MKKIMIIAVAVLVIIAAVFVIVRRSKKKPEIGEFTVKRGTISIDFRVSGTVEPRNRIEIKPEISGRIEDVLVVEGQKVKKGQVLIWMSSTERSALLDAVRMKSEAELKKWEDTYKPTPVISPIDGFIIARNKEPGQSVTGDVMLVMADKLIVKASVDETDLRHIALGQKVKITLDAYPEKIFHGVVEHVAYESKVINNVTVYEIKILPLEVPDVFRAGMTATVEVVSQRKEDILVVPSDVIAVVKRNKFVTLKTGDKTANQEVETGITDGKFTEIVSGLEEGDIIVSPKLSKREMRGFGLPGMGGGGRTRMR